VVNWQPAGGGGGGDLCGSYSNVIRQGINWGDNSRMLSTSMGGFQANGVIALSFVVPSSPASYNTAGNTSFAEYGEPATARQMTISKSACDFRTVDTTGANGPFTVAYGTSTFVGFNVGAAPLNLVPGQTYWINVRNYSPDLGGLSCSGSTCNGSLTTNWPK
jgi:hypothetical protein